MDTLLEDQTIQAVLGRTDFNGIENTALDFSQLEDYINDEEDGNETIYFTEALSNSDLKLQESSRIEIKLNSNFNSNGHFEANLNRPVSLNSHSLSSSLQSLPTPAPRTSNLNACSSSDYNKNSHSLNGSTFRNSSLLHPLSHQSNLNLDRSNSSVTNHRHPATSFNKNSQPHHLPESPPDSGSEPPYSPPIDENRHNGIVLTSSSKTSHSHHSHLHSNLCQKEMIHTDLGENIMHFGHYSGTSIKHLPNPTDLNLNVNSTHHQPSQNTTTNLTTLHPITTSLHSDGSILSYLETSLLSNPLAHQKSPVGSREQGTMPQVYNSNDSDYPRSGCGDCVTDCSHSHKKRKISDSPKISDNANLVHIKQEPNSVVSPEPPTNTSNLIPPSLGEEYGLEYNASHEDTPNTYLDSAYQCIKFQAFQQNTWNTICDTTLKELPPPNYRVDADKGFNFSNADDAFVCQKKNHFQVTVHIQPIGDPQYVKTPEMVKKIDNFYIHFYGVKVESLSQTIKVEQSQSDRSKKPFHPVLIQLTPDRITKTTVGRLHFNETTSNNMRKKGKPNPDQRYFYLVVSLCAHVGDLSYPIISYFSEKIIVRASNPGQFENDMDISWQKGYTPESIYHAGRVGINTDRPNESLVVHGSVKVTGHIIQPSDCRAKTNIEEMNTKEQLKNVSNIRVVRYKFTPEFAQQVGLSETEINGTGIIAQEVQQILPDAVREAGDVILPSGERIENFLVVNKERIFMENVGAVKELCKVTDNLETRIDELERMNNKLRKINRFDSIKSIISTSSVTSISTVTCTSSNYSGNTHGHSKRNRCSHKNFKNHHKFSKKDDSGNQVCTNRFMQSIIMILVLIMAFCLASIVTLYILDYPHRHTSSLSLHTSPIIDHNYENIVNNTPSQSKLFLLSTKLPNSQNTSNNIEATKKNVFDYNVMVNKARDKESSQKPNSIPILKPRLIGTPLSCLEANFMMPACIVHCCINPSVINRAGLIDVITYQDIDHHNIVKNENTEDKFINSIKNFNPSSTLPESSQDVTTSNGKKLTPMTNLFKSNELNSPELDSPLSTRLIDDSPIHVESGAHINNLGANGLSESSVTKQNLTEPNDTSDHAKNKIYLSENFDDTNKFGTYNDPNSKIYSKAEEFREKRQTRESMVNQQSPLYHYNVIRRDLSKSIESIKLLELNATIGREFCTTWQCVQGNGPSFTYLVSISKYMPFEFVTIQFSLSSPMKVDHCEHKDKPTSCPSLPPGADDVPHSYHRPIEHLPIAESSHSFRIPIGLYLKSTYVFRVLSKERNYETPCSLPESTIGVSYIEFKLIFTRKCEK